MSKKYELMFDPTPRGWVYGFPRPVPQEAVMGKGSDLWIKTDFDLTKWVTSFGYPAESFQYWKTWPQEIHEDCGTPECCGECDTSTKNYNPDEHQGGVEDFTTQYYYPGSDPQE